MLEKGIESCTQIYEASREARDTVKVTIKHYNEIEREVQNKEQVVFLQSY